jgi:hypothetical protein
MQTCGLLAPSISAFESSSDVISEPYDWDEIGQPKKAGVKIVSNKPLAKYSAISHGMRVQLLCEGSGENYYLAYLACRFSANKRTLLAVDLGLEKRAGQYRRDSPNQLYEIEIDSYLGYKVTLQDVYVASPRLDFALSLRPVRYQIADSSSILPYPEFFLCLMDDAVHKAGFTPVGYSPPEVDWGQLRSNPHKGASPGLRLWHHNKDSAVIYRNERTCDSFAVVIGTSQKFRSEPQGFMVGIVDDISSDTSATMVLEKFFKHSSHSLTDLSTQMLVKPLKSGKQVILSVNVIREQADVSPITVASFQNFRLWVVVNEAKI